MDNDVRESVRHILWKYDRKEILHLRSRIKDGMIQGSSYWTGGCGCILGSLESQRSLDFVTRVSGLSSISNENTRPAENYFYPIKKGDTPETSELSKELLELVEDYLRVPFSSIGEEDTFEYEGQLLIKFVPYPDGVNAGHLTNATSYSIGEDVLVHPVNITCVAPAKWKWI